MSMAIKEELVEFKKYHKNIYNVLFHILCGFVYMACIMENKYHMHLLVLYTLLILFTINDILLTTVIFVVLLIMIYLLQKCNISSKKLCMGFILFYFLPELSHYVTNEPTVLNVNNITPLNVFINIFYLLPFSIKSLT